ncbi:MAG: phasin family protein [Pseudomonadales bacterium]
MAKAKAKSKTTTSKVSPTDKAGDIAKNIWLAGLGAYGKAYDEAASRLEKASKDTPKLFHDLVQKGEKLEANKPEEIEESSINKIHKNARADIEERIEKMKQSLDITRLFSSPETDIERLEAKLDALTEKVELLAAAVNVKTKPKAKAKVKSQPKAKAKTKAKPKTKAKTAPRRKTVARK